MENKDFCAFILTHGRPDKVMTYTTLKKCGYTGPVFFIVDNEDKTVDQYIQNFGTDYVKIFDKKAYADQVDEGNNFDERRTITHARNACFDIAKELGFTYFIELDDDYNDFRFKIDSTGKYIYRKVINDLDKIFDILLNYFISINCLSIAMAQGGDFFGNADDWNAGLKKLSSHRKCMNSFICSTERPFKFVGAMNEDVNTYTTLGSRGNLFLTTEYLAIQQAATQSQAGGITDMYKKFGTHCKGFTSVIFQPSCVYVAMLRSNFARIHHSINWSAAVPVIIDEKHRKI